MPLHRVELEHYIIQQSVIREQMCSFSPMVFQDMMNRFVHDVSPDWSTVRMEIVADDPHRSWKIRVDGRGVRRPGGDRG